MNQTFPDLLESGLEAYSRMSAQCLSNGISNVQKEVNEAIVNGIGLMMDIRDRRPLNQRDPQDMLKMALRYLSGCGVPAKSNEGALWALDALLDPSCGPKRYIGEGIPPTLLAQAHSCAAHAYHNKANLETASERVKNATDERRFARPATLRAGRHQSPFDYFLLALEHAEASAELGLLSFAVTFVCHELCHLAENVCDLDLDVIMRRGKRFRALWRAIAGEPERNRVAWGVVQAWGHTRRRKLEGPDSGTEPYAFVCSALGCGQRGGKRGTFRECAGPCMAPKPHYCSRKCQRKDWPTHRADCTDFYPPDDRHVAVSDKEKARVLQLFEVRADAIKDGDIEDLGEAFSKALTTVGPDDIESEDLHPHRTATENRLISCT